MEGRVGVERGVKGPAGSPGRTELDSLLCLLCAVAQRRVHTMSSKAVPSGLIVSDIVSAVLARGFGSFWHELTCGMLHAPRPRVIQPVSLDNCVRP